ncbi:MAG: YraN family protein [Candidatus Electrothrix sp. AR3]|nr:YraN family protein [Candidatus Electrothrix sp. AR3]
MRRSPQPTKQGTRDKETGRVGEDAAVRYLEQQGYTILERNFRLRIGEVDIIARDGAYLVFIEVKTRRSNVFGSPFEAVNQRKQQRIARVALAYVARQPLEMPVRFDVAAVHIAGQTVRVELLKNAFDAG